MYRDLMKSRSIPSAVPVLSIFSPISRHFHFLKSSSLKNNYINSFPENYLKYFFSITELEKIIERI